MRAAGLERLGGDMGDFAEWRWSQGDWSDGSDVEPPWLTIDIHDSDVATITFASAQDEASRRFHLGTHPAIYFDLAEEAPAEDPDAEAAAFVHWAGLATGAEVAVEDVRALLATADHEEDPVDDFVEDTVARLLALADLDVPGEGGGDRDA
jgi:hypothetical protein